MTNPLNEVQHLWDSVAEDWDIQVGESGDENRVRNSDPLLWQYLGDVSGKCILDAGCGTGYLSRQLAKKGARVTGIDISSEMIRIAEKKSAEANLDIVYHVRSLTDPEFSISEKFDCIVSNYVLMDTPDIDNVMQLFSSVIKPAGTVVLVFSHPCFPQGKAVRSQENSMVNYPWDFSYFNHRKIVDPPWNHFKEAFIWYHRPLSDYWKSFTNAGFTITDFDEPHERLSAEETDRIQQRPFSVIFKLTKN